MQLNIGFYLLFLNYFLINVKSLDLIENSDEIEIFKQLFVKLNYILSGTDSMQKELSQIRNRIQHLEDKLSQTSATFNGSTLLKDESLACKRVTLISSAAQSLDNYCFGNNWTIIQRRNDGSENFYRDWRDYKRGFGNTSNEFFAGLEKIHQMTKDNPHELLIIIQDYDNLKVYAKYDKFEIGSEEEGYILKSVGTYSGNAGDSLTYHKGAKFSTKGHDNDQHLNFNCAERLESAWWFKTCFESNLNGCYSDTNMREPKRAVACGIHWKTFRGQWYSLKFVEIMLRPILIN